MSQLDYRVFTATVASGTTTSNEVDLKRSYRKVYLFIPASAVGTNEIWGCDESGGTFHPIYHSGATAGVIASAVSNMYVSLQDEAYMRYVKVIATTAPADGATYKFVCFE